MSNPRTFQKPGKGAGDHMTPLDHADANKLGREIDRDFSYVTKHTGTSNPARKGQTLPHTFYADYKTFGGTDQNHLMRNIEQYNRIMAGESLEAVFEEDGILTRVSNALSNLKSFSFGSGSLSKAASTGSSSGSNAPLSSKPGFVPANSLDDLRKNAQAQADRMKAPAAKPATTARPAMKPASESALPSFGLSKSSSLSKSLMKKSTAKTPSIRSAAEEFISRFRS